MTFVCDAADVTRHVTCLFKVRILPRDLQVPEESISHQACKIGHPNWFRLAPIGTNMDFIRSVSVHFGLNKSQI